MNSIKERMKTKMMIRSEKNGTPGYSRKRAAAFLLAFLLLSAAFLQPAAALAENGEKVVRVGWYDSSFNRMDEHGCRSGYAYEYQIRIAAYTGWKYEYVKGSWSELLALLQEGSIDLMSDISYTPERAETMLYPSLPMGSEEYYLFVSQANQEISSANPASLNGKKIGVNKDSVQAGFFREWAELHGVQCELLELMNSEDDSLRMLKSGELDGYVTVDFFSVNTASEAERPVPVFRIGSSDFFFAVSKNRTDLLEDLEKALNRIQEENRYYNQQMADKHFVTTGANAFLTAEEKAWLEKHGPIRVGYQDNYMAFCAKDPETGELTGALKDYLDQAANCVVNAHLDFETAAYPTAAAAIEAMKKGEVDCVFPANLSASDGEEMGLFMTPELMRTDVFAVVRESERQIFVDREHVVVAVNEENPNYDSFLQEHYPSWRTVYYPTTADCLKAVSRGVADCVLISSYRYSNIARQCESLSLTTVITGAGLDYCLAVNAGEPELYSILTKVADLVPEFTINSFLSRYMTEEAKGTLGDFFRANPWVAIAPAGAALLVILFLLVRSMRANRKAKQLIAATETDQLTGLYNREYFLEYAGRIQQEHPETPMDAIAMNIDRFHAVNAMNGRAFGDRVLRALGSGVQEAAKENGGIAGRFQADRFDIYCRHLDDYQALYKKLQRRLEGAAPDAGIRLRMGVMPWQEGLEPIQMFDRARTACSLARENYRDHLVVYDQEMQDREFLEQRLLNDLQRALESYEFEVYYQPQYDIRQDPPKLSGAEALVRWNHPELGMIMPNDFVPLLERHGKIGEVDRYVWAEAARQAARCRDLFGVTIPVSVNLSRVDVFDPALESALDQLLAYNGLSQGTLKLEVTESSYTENADQVVRVVENLRRKGYVVEMDDFGTGYSSLNMLSAMPVDVLKMDREFIRRIGTGEKDRHLVALIIGIAGNLKIPVVAEGVETEEQLQMLRELGCQLVQGYYFSKPLPANEFEELALRAMKADGDRPSL